MLTMGAIAQQVASERSGEMREDKTTESGDFFFGVVVPRPYTVQVEATGFCPLELILKVVLAGSSSCATIEGWPVCCRQ
jgi:hypothetical protein